jgi:hypothetical protein
MSSYLQTLQSCNQELRHLVSEVSEVSGFPTRPLVLPPPFVTLPSHARFVSTQKGRKGEKGGLVGENVGEVEIR